MIERHNNIELEGSYRRGGMN